MVCMSIEIDFNPVGEPPYCLTVFHGQSIIKKYYLDLNELRDFWDDNEDVWSGICDKMLGNET